MILAGYLQIYSTFIRNIFMYNTIQIL